MSPPSAYRNWLRDRRLAKLYVVGSIPIARSNKNKDLERFPLRLNRDSQSEREGGVFGGDSPFWGCQMARPYSWDLRERVVEAVNEGATRSEAADRFDVSISSAVRWHLAWRETGRFAAKPYGGSRSPLEDYAEEIIALVEEQRDRTLDEIVAAMHERRIPGSRTALFRFLERHGITFKKSPARQRAGAYGRDPRPQALDPRARAA
jgi:transposase